MRLHYWDKTTLLANYPNIIGCMMVAYNEFMITYIDGLGVVNTRRLIIDETHHFTVEKEYMNSAD